MCNVTLGFLLHTLGKVQARTNKPIIGERRQSTLHLIWLYKQLPATSLIDGEAALRNCGLLVPYRELHKIIREEAGAISSEHIAVSQTDFLASQIEKRESRGHTDIALSLDEIGKLF